MLSHNIYFFQSGFHKAVGEHNVSLSKRISGGLLNMEDENARNK
jgi:hypothetical protein